MTDTTSFESLIALLDLALKSQFGVKVNSEDPDALRRRLYVVMREVRMKSSDGKRFAPLALRLSPDDSSALFIVKDKEHAEKE